MKTKHMILRFPEQRLAPRRTRGLRAGSFDVRGDSAPRVEVDEIGRRDVAGLKNDATVAAVAVAMPMKLVRPAADLGPPAHPSATIAWGVTAVGADRSPFTGDGIVAAVLDTGIDPAHPAFQGGGLELLRKNFTSDGDDDQDGHGTHCAGTIFGRAVGATRIGVAPGIKKALIGKVIGHDGADSTNIAEAITWAVSNGAHVISMSLGIDFPGYVRQLIDDGLPSELATSRALEGYRANILLFERLASFVRAQSAMLQPTLLVAAAGNESRKDVDPEFEISVAPPAVSEGIISVAALGAGGGGLTVASFSNTGALVSGPGVAVVSAKRGGGLTTLSGTSMATPHVAGVAALWAEKLNRANSLTFTNLQARLIGSCVGDGLASGFDPADVGAGIVQAPQA